MIVFSSVTRFGRAALCGFVCGLVVPLTLVASLNADVILWYDFTGQPGDQVTQSASFVDENASAGVLFRGDNLFPEVLNDAFYAKNWTNSPTIGDDHFFGFSITVDPGYFITIDGISFAEQRGPGGPSETGPRMFEIRSSTDNFATFVSHQIVSIPDDALIRDHSFALTGLENLTGTVDFRIFGFDAENSGTNSRWALRNNTATGGLTLHGNLAVVPEPSSMVLVGLGLLAAAGWFGTARRRPDVT